MAYNYQTDTGTIIPDTSSIRSEVEEEFRSAFGQDLNTDPSTPQGTLITRITEERDFIARQNADLANQINPDIAGGIFLDAIWALSRGSRKPRQPVRINGVELTGDPATTIPAGSSAYTESGEEFLLVADVLLNGAGTGTGVFESTSEENFSVAPGQLNTIGTPVTGWDAITNPNQSTPAVPEESDAQARRRRMQTMALQTISTREAIISRIMNIESVRSMNFLENTASSTQTISGVSMSAHSIWACVEGGTNEEIADALYRTKTVGAQYNNSGGTITTVNVTDPWSGQITAVRFSRPTEINVLVRVTVSPIALDVQTLIPMFVMNYVNGLLEGDVSFVIGKNVSPFEIGAAVNSQNPSLTVKKVEVSLTSPVSWTTNELSISAFQIARLTSSGVTVVVS